jgi:hypothetical protein
MSERNEGGQPGNNNAEKHTLFSDRQKLYERLDPHEKEIVVEIATDLLEKFDGEVGAYEREAIRNVSIDVVKRWRYNEHTLDGDILDETSETARNAYNKLAKRTTRELEQLGLLDEGPESRKADAMESGWMSQIEDADNSAEE